MKKPGHAARAGRACVTKILKQCQPDPCDVFTALARWEPFALLQSASFHAVTGKRSVLGMGPQPLFECKDSRDSRAPQKIQNVLDDWQNAWAVEDAHGYGCVFMVFSYEWKNALEPGAEKANDLDFPYAWLVASRDVLVWDHEAGSLTLHCSYQSEEPGERQRALQRTREMEETLRGHDPEMRGHDPILPFKLGSCPRISGSRISVNNEGWQHDWRPGMSREAFLAKVLHIQEYIAAGDIYQANLSQRFTKTSYADGLDLYAAMQGINPSPFAGYLRTRSWELISCSPERLISKQGRTLTTRPIAGTRPRGEDVQADGHYEKDLLLSPKERAEHIMLVDLERNDLGRVCRKGSVRVDEMMGVEKYSHVQHIVSNVQGTLLPRATFMDILRAAFPGGTITGVPKIRCMQILDELEPTARGPYTGSFGYYDAHGNFDLNIAIRTILKKGNGLTMQTGAGIVADSIPEGEYQETLDKAKAMALAVEICSATIQRAVG